MGINRTGNKNESEEEILNFSLLESLTISKKEVYEVWKIYLQLRAEGNSHILIMSKLSNMVDRGLIKIGVIYFFFFVGVSEISERFDKEVLCPNPLH